VKYKICKLSELSEELIDQSAAICVEGLYNIFSIISKDKNVLKELFKESFDNGMNYACLHENEVVGFLGLGDSSKRAAGNMKRETFEKLFGKRKSNMMYKGVSSGFVKPKLKSEKEVEIEFLITAEHFRGKGVGTLLIRYICDNFHYESCVLDVYSKNPNAKRLYERLGFKQVKITTNWMLWLRGIGRTITMKLNLRHE
jgi:ribosomal protein S18 acetylase RimI-like enzyme